MSCANLGNLIQLQQSCLEIEVVDERAQSIELRLLYRSPDCLLQAMKCFICGAITGFKQYSETADRVGGRLSIRRRPAYLLFSCARRFGERLPDGPNLSAQQRSELVEQ